MHLWYSFSNTCTVTILNTQIPPWFSRFFSEKVIGLGTSKRGFMMTFAACKKNAKGWTFQDFGDEPSRTLSSQWKGFCNSFGLFFFLSQKSASSKISARDWKTGGTSANGHVHHVGPYTGVLFVKAQVSIRISKFNTNFWIGRHQSAFQTLHVKQFAHFSHWPHRGKPSPEAFLNQSMALVAAILTTAPWKKRNKKNWILIRSCQTHRILVPWFTGKVNNPIMIP